MTDVAKQLEATLAASNEEASAIGGGIEITHQLIVSLEALLASELNIEHGVVSKATEIAKKLYSSLEAFKESRP